MKRIVVLIVILFSFSSYVPAQECDTPGFQYCNGGCNPAATCNRKNPPPPGLVVPIDTSIQFLLIAGLGLGIYFFGFHRNDFRAILASRNKRNK
ncbi:MAG: hypothetical protein R6U03_10970 [Gillisia sp.]